MDHIPFAKVSIEEAKATLQTGGTQARVLPQVRTRWETRRAPQQEFEQDLDTQTFKWLATLPKESRPSSLAVKFPRIVNRLAKVWKRPLQCEHYLDDLMIDRRGGRQGFPSDVAADIAKLKVHFLSTCRTVRYDVWGERV
ncbi:MAG TPA: hypothetical protein VJ652_06860 [Noviherbaspirillum sp.]|nr:hypothetical protein [Noviherbaspirillum sp.]